MNIYVASSWRNPYQQDAVRVLRRAGFEVYDFRNPVDGEHGFQWSEIDPKWQSWSLTEFRSALSDPVAEHGFGRDWQAMHAADACLLVLPCGRSSHLEAGWFSGAGRPTVVWLADGEPELMYKMTTELCVNLPEAVAALEKIRRERGSA